MSDLTDAMDAFFAKLKAIPAGVANKLNGKTPAEIANSMDKSAIGLGNIQNYPKATLAEAEAVSASDRYLDAAGAAAVGDTAIQFMKYPHSAQPPLRGKSDSTRYIKAEFLPLVIDFCIIEDNTMEFNARAYIEGNGEGGYVDVRDNSYFYYSNSTWVDYGVNSAISRLTKNSLLLSPFDGRTYFIDQNGDMTALYD